MNTQQVPDHLRVELAAIATVSDKIRRLNQEGYERADIARMLGKRYQHVRNVLEADVKKAESAGHESIESTSREPVELAHRFVVTGDGTLNLTPQMMEALGLSGGGILVARLDGGELRLSEPRAALDRARALVRALDRGEGSPVDELIAERRREARE